MPGESKASPGGGAWEISPRDARDLLDGPAARAVLIDCRTPEEHATARIEGSVLMPLAELPSRLAELSRLGDRAVIVHCHHGVRSLRAAAVLREHGFDGAVSMAGGIDRWSLEVDPRVPRY